MNGNLFPACNLPPSLGKMFLAIERQPLVIQMVPARIASDMNVGLERHARPFCGEYPSYQATPECVGERLRAARVRTAPSWRDVQGATLRYAHAAHHDETLPGISRHRLYLSGLLLCGVYPERSGGPRASHLSETLSSGWWFTFPLPTFLLRGFLLSCLPRPATWDEE